VTSVESPTFLVQLTAGCPVDGPVDTSPAEERIVRGVDDSVYIEGRDVAPNDADSIVERLGRGGDGFRAEECGWEFDFGSRRDSELAELIEEGEIGNVVCWDGHHLRHSAKRHVLGGAVCRSLVGAEMNRLQEGD